MSKFYVDTMSYTWAYADIFVQNVCHVLYFVIRFAEYKEIQFLNKKRILFLMNGRAKSGIIILVFH